MKKKFGCLLLSLALSPVYAKSTTAQQSYALGYQVGSSVVNQVGQETPFSKKSFMEGIKAGVLGKASRYSEQDRQQYIADLQSIQKQKADEARDKATLLYKNDLFNDKNWPTGKNKAGQVVLVEFFDYFCPHCHEVNEPLAAILEKNKDVEIIYRDLPILGPQSWIAARIAMHAYGDHDHDLYLSTHDKLFSSIKDKSYDQDAMAKQMGLDNSKIDKQDVDMQKLNETQMLARELNVAATPSIVIANRASLTTDHPKFVWFDGAATEAALQAKIDEMKDAKK